MADIHEFAPAKLNLYLHVGPPLANGRHPLDSLVVFADIGDELWIESAAPGSGEGLSLTLEGPFAAALAPDPDNLVLRAGRALAAAVGSGGLAPARLRLAKHLPVASGIGGGSADAAAALRGLNRFWGLGLDRAALAPIAASLGADVPACLDNLTAHMTGTGEDLARAAAPLMPALLVNALIPAPTGPVYRRFDEMGLGRDFAARHPPVETEPGAFIAALASFNNDLTAPAIALTPGVKACLDALSALENTHLVRMSGSGATCFALFADDAAMRAAAQRLGGERPDWWIAPCHVGDRR